MGKISLKARNPFGKDIEMVSTRTWIGLGAFAGMIAVVGAMVVFFKGKTSKIGTGTDALYERLRSV